MTSDDTLLIGARWLQYLAVLLLAGLPLFALYALPYARRGEAWLQRRLLGADALALLAGVVWLAAQTLQLSDDPQPRLTYAGMAEVVRATQFGQLQLARLLAELLYGMACLGLAPASRAAALGLLGSVLCVSLAWSGHGHLDAGAAGALHLAADGLHLLSAAIWFGALVGLWGLHRQRQPALLADAVMRFGRIGVALIGVLALTGVINSLYLIGISRAGALLHDRYGQLLLLKLTLFGLMLGLAAVNRYRHTPRLQRMESRAPRAFARSLHWETLLGLAVLAVVAVLGTLPPPVSQ